MRSRILALLIGAALVFSFQISSVDSATTTNRTTVNAQQSRSAGSSSTASANVELQSSRAISKFVTVAGTRLHYLVQGAGRPVVLIHGNPGSAQDWTPVLAAVASRHRVIAFDRPGHGLSKRPKHEATVEVQAQLIHDALAQLRIERPIIVGHSWAAALALVYAINYPKDIAGIVVVAPAVYESHDGGGGFLTELPAVPVIGDVASYTLTPIFGSTVVHSELKKAFSPDPVPKNYLKFAVAEWTKPNRVRAYAQDNDLFNQSVKEFSPRYPEISAPLSILVGDSDLIVPKEENAERLHTELPKSRLVVLPKTGHQIPFTRPQVVVNEIERLFRLSTPRR